MYNLSKYFLDFASGVCGLRLNSDFTKSSMQATIAQCLVKIE